MRSFWLGLWLAVLFATPLWAQPLPLPEVPLAETESDTAGSRADDGSAPPWADPIADGLGSSEGSSNPEGSGTADAADGTEGSGATEGSAAQDGSGQAQEGSSESPAQPTREELEAAARAIALFDDATTRDVTTEQIRSDVEAIRGLLEGRLPASLQTESLFVVDLRNEQALQRRREELQADIDARRAALAQVVQSLSTRESSRALALLALAEARLDFLNVPARTRIAVLQAEEEAMNLRREQQEAAAAQARAQEDERIARAAQEAALEEARAAATEVERQLANQRASIERVAGDIAAERADFAAEQAAESDARQQRVDQLFLYGEQAAQFLNESREMDDFYQALADASITARSTLRHAIAAVRPLPEAPEPIRIPDEILDLSGRDSEETRAMLERVAALNLSALTLHNERVDFLLTVVLQRAALERELERLRLDVLQRTSPAMRDRVLGFSRSGIETLQNELNRLRLIYELTLMRLEHPSAEFRDVVWLTATAVRGLVVLVLLALWMWLRGRGWPMLRTLQRFAATLNPQSRLRAPVRRTVAVVTALYGQGLFMLCILAVGRALGDLRAVPLVALLYSLGFWLAVYQLTLTAAHKSISNIAQRATNSLDAAQSDRILGSLRTIGRYVFAVGVVLTVSRSLVGPGYIHTLVRTFAWMGVIPITLVLLYRWRPHIVHAYLRKNPQGALVATINARASSPSLATTVAALAVVALDATRNGLHALAMGFEHSRRALAYLFRRRLEKSSITPTTEEFGLPPELDQLFTPGAEAAVEDDTSHASLVRPLVDDIVQWTTKPRIGSAMVVADVGVGKSSVLETVVSRTDTLPHVRVSITERTLDRKVLLQQVCIAFGLPTATSMAAFVEHARQLPHTVVIMDDVERLMLRGVHAREAWKALEELIHDTGRRLYWLCAMSRLPWEYLRWRGEGAAFRQVTVIPRWTEEAIETLMRGRVERTGKALRLESLFAGDIEGVSGDATSATTMRDLARLLWDYADGSPAVALWCWRQMLVLEADDRMRVRLFQQKDVGQLEVLSEAQRFTLAAVAWHTELTAEHAERSLGLDALTIRQSLRHLQDLGVIEVRGDSWRMTVGWLAPATRYLRRKHLIL